MTATINDVASKSGIDPIIVQRILSAGLMDIDIGMDRIQQVLELAKAEGYVSKPHSLGIIYAEESSRGLTHPFFVLILNAFKQEAERHGYDITFINHDHMGNDMSYLDRCRNSHLDGVCMVCVDFESPEIKELVGSELPCVTIDHIFKRVPSVLSDNETGVQRMVEYAISRGHERIAFVHGHNNSVVTRTRINQFRNVMDYYNLAVPPEYVRESRYDDVILTRKIVRELLELPQRPTCILLPDDIAYFGAQDAARELGLHIPEDISFAGYDGIPLSQALTPKLTTVRQSTDQMGMVAAQRLIDLIENPKAAKRIPTIFPVEIIEGGTIAELAKSS